MTEHPTSSTIDQASPPSDGALVDPFVEIAALARRGGSHISFLTNAFRRIAAYFACPYAAIHVSYAAEVVQDDWHTGSTDPNFWKSGLQQFLTESLAEPAPRARLLRSRTDRTTAAYLASPVVDDNGRPIGAIALVLVPIADDEVEDRLSTLGTLARFASYTAGLVKSGGQGGGSTGPAAGSAAPSAALARAATCRTMEELAFAITNDLCNKLDCEQVALGIVVGRRVRVVSISGMDTVRRQSPGVVHLRGAMEECLDAGTPIAFDRAGGWATDQMSQSYRLHKQWHTATQGDAVVSIPLREAERICAVISIRKRADAPLSSEQIDSVRERVEPFMPALRLTDRAARSFVRHACDSLGESIKAVMAPRRLGRKITVGLALVAVTWFAFGTVNYDLTVPCIVRPAQIRHVTAPFEGVLASASVLEGDSVRQGQVLCRLDDRDLVQQRTELLAELAVLERTKDRAMAESMPVEVQLALANQHLVQAKLDIVNQRIEQTVLRAPMDGVIVKGDLRKSIGSVVARGDPFFEVAPLGDWTLELEVAESASADLSTAMTGLFAGYARPDETHEFRIARVLAEAQIRQGRNAYIAEADFTAQAGWIRPGMEGVAKIHVGPRPVWWITLHRVIDYLRMSLWL